MKTPTLTYDKLCEVLEYDPNTGEFTWAKRLSNRAIVGKRAGWRNPAKDSYIRISIEGRTYLAHRLAWMYCYGSLPEKYLDHIDGNPENNRIDNLRECNQSENNQNARRRVDNTSGHVGVVAFRGKWKAEICLNREVSGLGVFDTKAEAIAAYLGAKRVLHRFQPTPINAEPRKPTLFDKRRQQIDVSKILDEPQAM